MAVRKKSESTEDVPKVSLKSRLQDVQQALDLVRSQIRQFDFTPEQVFGYLGKADASNLKREASGQASPPPAAKKAAAKRAAKAVNVAEDTRAAPLASNTVKTALNPAAAWPFPAGSRR
ncbi:hypothetical protein [Burkholderia sp. Ax-1719]|uniref:hypothetical protein n=1 Tax=Burkholderia sp. Ax-1719 TaxID=2608334 RepID=UPI001F048A59|nr:hypothetical protein [Burkholderia sp. Ax-1719]